MTPNRYTEVASQASDRYLTVLATFRGMLLGSLSEPFSAARAAQLRTSAVDVGRMFMRSEVTLIEQEVSRTALDALRAVQSEFGASLTTTIPDDLADFVEQQQTYLESEVRSQLSRDVEMLVRRYREAALEAHLEARSTGRLYSPTQPIGADRTKFYFRDRVGRLYPSQKFIRSTWRLAMVITGAEFFAIEAAQLGANKLTVVLPGSHADGDEISLDGSFAPSFSDVRDELFHPMSNATLRAVDVSAQ